eukprot:11127662-Prorocentrum_lima.AAC.1
MPPHRKYRDMIYDPDIQQLMRDRAMNTECWQAYMEEGHFDPLDARLCPPFPRIIFLHII